MSDSKPLSDEELAAVDIEVLRNCYDPKSRVGVMVLEDACYVRALKGSR